MQTPHQWEKPLEALAYLNGQPQASGLIKASPSDFIVEEELGFTPTGEGEHVFIKIEKTGLNTADVCKRISKALKLSVRQITYSGLKDKNAKTLQWLSFPWPIKKPLDCSVLDSEQLRVLEVTRHQKKLRIGTHKANRFVIRVTQVSSMTDIVERIERIKSNGVPNYFGEQRFGRFGNNLQFAQRLFVEDETIRDRKLQGLVLSAARSHLFNMLVSQRIASNAFEQIIDGDILQLAGSRSHFSADINDVELKNRLRDKDIDITAPMIGEDIVLNDVAQEVLADYSEWIQGLQKQRMNTEHRAIRVIPKHFEFTQEDEAFTVSFELPTGSFATAVLREIIDFE